MNNANEPSGNGWLSSVFLGAPSQYGALPLLLLFGFFLVVLVLAARKTPRFLAAFVYALAIIYVIMAGEQILAMMNLLPAWMEAYVPPHIMSYATVIGAGLIYGSSYFPVVQTILGIGDRYFRSSEPSSLRIGPFGTLRAREGTIGMALLIFIILLNLSQVAISVRINFWYRDLFNALQAKQVAAFWYQGIIVFFPMATVWVVSQMVEYAASILLRIRWRTRLNTHYVTSWLANGTHYEMQLTGTGTDNPDQRIADDLRDFVDQTLTLALQILNQVATLVSFILILWSLSSGFTIPGTEVVVPGLLVWVALAYATLGTWLTHVIGRPLIGLYFQKEKVEADYRFSLARIREYGEQIALLNGQHAEGERLTGRFSAVVANFLATAMRYVKMESFRLSFRQLNVIFPFLLAAPYYFVGKLEFGQIQQTIDAFSSVQAALNFFILAYATLAAYKAVVDRLTTFETALKGIRREHLEHPKAKVVRSDGRDVQLDDVTVRLPDGSVLAGNLALDFRKGEATLFTGPSGAGKSTLFRTIAGIWPFASGRICIPKDETLLELPQRPYIPQGTLRDAVTYPATSGTYSDAAIVAALTAAKLEAFTGMLDEEKLWGQTLSLGEQQRLAVARALLAKPDWLLLDEATAALDEKTEAEIYAVLKLVLPQTTIISIGHRSTLHAFHARRIDLQKNDSGQPVWEDIALAR